jgi:hypothetical protein
MSAPRKHFDLDRLLGAPPSRRERRASGGGG